MSQELSQITGNYLLAALPGDAYERLRPNLEPITFSLGEVVYESGGHIRYVYFPTTSHISLWYTMIDGSTAEMGLNILDRQQLLAYVCECYQVVKAEHERLLGLRFSSGYLGLCAFAHGHSGTFTCYIAFPSYLNHASNRHRDRVWPTNFSLCRSLVLNCGFLTRAPDVTKF